MALDNQEKIKVLENLYVQLTKRYEQRLRILDTLNSNTPGCGEVGQRGFMGFDGFPNVLHGVSCVQQMKDQIDNVEKRINLIQNPPEPLREPTDQELFDIAISDLQDYKVNIVELVQGLRK